MKRKILSEKDNEVLEYCETCGWELHYHKSDKEEKKMCGCQKFPDLYREEVN